MLQDHFFNYYYGSLNMFNDIAFNNHMVNGIPCFIQPLFRSMPQNKMIIVKISPTKKWRHVLYVSLVCIQIRMPNQKTFFLKI
jgi:hypothetical protein